MDRLTMSWERAVDRWRRSLDGGQKIAATVTDHRTITTDLAAIVEIRKATLAADLPAGLHDSGPGLQERSIGCARVCSM
jgi:hypothetical protein